MNAEDRKALTYLFLLLYKMEKEQHLTKTMQYLCMNKKTKSCGNQHNLSNDEIEKIEKELKEING